MKQMKEKILLGIFALFVIAIASAGVLAYKGNPDVRSPNYNAEVHEQLEAAIEAGNYGAWLKIRQDNNLPMQGRMFQVINENNFDRYVALHKANTAGDVDAANAIKAELGLGQGKMQRQGNGSCDGTCKRA